MTEKVAECRELTPVAAMVPALWFLGSFKRHWFRIWRSYRADSSSIAATGIHCRRETGVVRASAFISQVLLNDRRSKTYVGYKLPELAVLVG